MKTIKIKKNELEKFIESNYFRYENIPFHFIAIDFDAENEKILFFDIITSSITGYINFPGFKMCDNIFTCIKWDKTKILKTCEYSLKNYIIKNLNDLYPYYFKLEEF